jgi:hypothetical protein
MQPEQMAELVHEVNRLITIAIGDEPQPHWRDAPPRMREDTLHLIRHTLAHPGKTAEEDHVEWMRAKAAAGWVYGPAKDEAARTHPMMVPYEQLPAGQRLKNRALPALILALAQE